MWRVGAEGEWHLWFSAFQGKTSSDFVHLGTRSDCNDCHSKKKKKNPSRFWPHGKCATDELLGRMTQKKMAFKNKTVVSHFVKFIVHGVGEIHCSRASRSVLACWWQNLMMVEKDMMNFRLDCLISSPPQI